MKVYRHKGVVFGVNASPFLLGATIEHHLQKALNICSDMKGSYSKDNIELLLKSFYVDNCVISLPDIKVTQIFVREASEVMQEAGFDLRGWEYSGQADEGEKTTPLLGLN